MKFVAFALLALSSFSMAQAVELDATQALLETLKPGIYSGVTVDAQESCNVEVKQIPQGILVTASTTKTRVSRSVGYGTVYRWNPGQRMFLSSDNFYREDVSEEVVFRTIAVNESRQYTVVSHQRTIGRDRVFNTQIECVVDLE